MRKILKEFSRMDGIAQILWMFIVGWGLMGFGILVAIIYAEINKFLGA